MDDFGNDTGAMPLDSHDDQVALLRRLQLRTETLKESMAHVGDEVAQIRAQVMASDLGNLHIIEQQKQLAAALQINTEATARIEAATAGLVELFNAAQGAFAVLEKLGKLAKPIGYIAGAVTAVVGAWELIRRIKP